MADDDTGSQADRSDWDAALVTLYETNYTLLVRSAHRLLGSSALAEEAVQDSIIKYQSAPRRPAPGKELAYLHSIVLNTARGMLRRRTVAERWRPEAPPADDPEEQALQAVLSGQVRQALQALPARQREVLALRHWGALSERETSRHLNISAGAVKTHASRGRAALRDLLVEVA